MAIFYDNHKNSLNILLHFITTTIGIISLLSLLNINTILLIFIFSSILILSNNNFSMITKLITIVLYAFYSIFSNLLNINYIYKYILILSSYFGQGLVHLITNEPTYISTYITNFNISTIFTLLDHIIFIVPYLIESCFKCNEFMEFFISKNDRIIYGNITNDNNDSMIKLMNWVITTPKERLENLHQTETTHWLYKDIPVKQYFDNITQSILNKFYDKYNQQFYTIDVLDDMNEVYVSALRNGDISSDTVFETPHIDGPCGIFPFINTYRTIVAISDNKYITTHFPYHENNEFTEFK